MNSGLSCDEDLLRRLPLPLAQLYRRAHNAKSALESHLAAFYLWEAGLKLLAAAALVEHSLAAQSAAPLSDDQRRDLQNLARPSLGHWWRFVKILLPCLADGGDERFSAARDLLLGRARDDMPRAAGLDAALRELLSGQGGSRATIKLADLFDRLVQLRNEELGHGAVGARSRGFYERTGPALLAGVAEVFARLDVRAGRRLVYVADVHRQPAGGWLVERYELTGEAPRRLESLEVPEAAVAQLPRPGRVYLEAPRPAAISPQREAISVSGPEHGQTTLARATTTDGEDEPSAFHCLHPLLAYDVDANEVRFFNEFDRKSQRLAYLCYTTSATTKQPDLDGDYLRLLARVLGQPVETEQVEQWADQAAADQAATAEEDDSSLRHIGEFELQSKLGWGGMGVVYRARQPTLGRVVALKLMRQVGNPRAESRFAREIRALGHVEHPNLVKVFTSGADGERWFYTMELVEGTTLEAVQTKLTSGGSRAGELDLTKWKETLSVACAETRKAEEPVSGGSSNHLPVAATAHSAPTQPAPATATSTVARAPTDRSYLRQMAELIRQVADADHALHEAGVVHRDIKPGNIMVTDDGNRAVLMDLGLAQLTDEIEGRLTRTREFLGTPRYASPEQVLAAGRVDRRSDIYSLGATLWELLTLRPMYGAIDETPFAEVARRIQIREPERVRKFNARVPRDLDAIVLKCLEKDPDRRYATARELATDLQHFLRGQPVSARPVGDLERMWRWCRRNPLVSGLLATVVAVVVAGLVGVIWKWRDAEANLSRAKAAELKAADAAARAHREADNAHASQLLAEAQRRQADESRYAADMRLAQEAADEGDVARAMSLLQRYSNPPPGEDMRGFEWRDLWGVCQGDSLATYHGFGDQVRCVAYSPDGKTVAAGCADSTLRLLDPEANAAASQLHVDGPGIMSVAFSPNGKMLACSTGNWQRSAQPGKVYLWEWPTRRALGALAEHTASVNAVTFSADGKYLATCSEDDSTMLWTIAGPEAITKRARLPGHSSGVNCVGFSPDSSLLAAGSGDGNLQVWEVESGLALTNGRADVSGIMSLAFSPDGASLLIGTRDGPILWWDVKTRKSIASLGSNQGQVNSIAFSPDKLQFASGGSNGTILVWDAAQRQVLRRLGGHSDTVLSISYSPVAEQLVSGSGDRTVKTWNPTRNREVPTFNYPAAVAAVAFSPDGKFLAATGGATADPQPLQQQTTYLWELGGNKPPAILVGHEDVIYSAAFSPNSRLLATGSLDHTINLWDVVTQRQLTTLRGHTDLVGTVRFSPDGATLASGSRDRTIKLWSMPDPGREPLATLKGHDGTVRSVSFSPDGNLLASAGSDRTVRLWQLKERKQIALLGPYPGTFNQVEFSADGSLLAAAANDRTVRLWSIKGDNAAPQELATLQGYKASMNCLALSRNGQTLAAGSQDSSLILWNVETKEEVALMRAHCGGISAVTFSPDGNTLATGSLDQTIKLWQAAKLPDPADKSPSLEGWTHP